MKYHQLLFILLLAFLSSGCQRKVAESLKPSQPAPTTSVNEKMDAFLWGEQGPGRLTVRGLRLQKPDSLAKEPIRYLLPRAQVGRGTEVREWREADRRVRLVLKRYEGHPSIYRVAQLDGITVLGQYLLEADPSEEGVMEAIDYYTSLVDEYNSPEALVLARCLQRLEKHWPQDQRLQMTERVLKRARESIARMASHCPSLQEEDLIKLSYNHQDECLFYADCLEAEQMLVSMLETAD